MIENPKPCPFCGATEWYSWTSFEDPLAPPPARKVGWITCMECGAQGPEVEAEETANGEICQWFGEAVRVWNSAHARMPHKLCVECGLPIPICNALTFYRQAQQALTLNRIDEARRYMERASEEYARYRATATPQNPGDAAPESE